MEILVWQKNKKRKKVNVKRKMLIPTNISKTVKVKAIAYRKVLVKWLPNTDEFQVYFDLYMNKNRLTMLGTIDPDKSYFKGIRIVCKNPQPWMTVKELQVARADAPGLFAVLKAYCHTVGDVLDNGAKPDEIVPGIMYKEGELFSDSEIVSLFRYEVNEPYDFPKDVAITHDNFNEFIMSTQHTRTIALQCATIGEFQRIGESGKLQFSLF
jgi:hypothetical protein|nr:MAG TPA: hypothetical protein [Caudoviricetes sp.]